jgi:4-oxalocrotonate tautomerase
MPIIRVEMFKGRNREQKRLLVRELTDTYVRVAGGKPDSVTVILQDVDKEDWGAAGALMADKYPD